MHCAHFPHRLFSVYRHRKKTHLKYDFWEEKKTFFDAKSRLNISVVKVIIAWTRLSNETKGDSWWWDKNVWDQNIVIDNNKFRSNDSPLSIYDVGMKWNGHCSLFFSLTFFNHMYAIYKHKRITNCTHRILSQLRIYTAN